MAEDQAGRSLVPLGNRQMATLGTFAKKVAALIAPSSVDNHTPFEDTVGIGPENLALRSAFEKNAERVIDRSEEILRDRGVKEAEPVPLVLGKAILEGAGEEDRPSLTEMWARLLASARDPATRAHVRKDFVRVLREMDPLDALVFELVDTTLSVQPSQRSDLATRLGEEEVAIELSLQHLIQLGLARNKNGASADHTMTVSNISMAPLGVLLRRALR